MLSLNGMSSRYIVSVNSSVWVIVANIEGSPSFPNRSMPSPDAMWSVIEYAWLLNISIPDMAMSSTKNSFLYPESLFGLVFVVE